MNRRQHVPQLPVQAEEFILTEQHIALLCQTQIRWHQPVKDEFGPMGVGGPGMCHVRPYGNRDVARDVADICCVPYDPDVLYGQGTESDALRASLMKLHEETLTALQIVLETRSFTPGHYFKQHCFRWMIVPVLNGDVVRISTRPLTDEMRDHLIRAAHAAITLVGSEGTYFTLGVQADVETALAYLREQRILHSYEMVNLPGPSTTDA